MHEGKRICSTTGSVHVFMISCFPFKSVPPSEKKLLCKSPKTPSCSVFSSAESDRWEHRPLVEAIVLKAREMHLGGATVLRGPMGFGKTSRLHTTSILNLSTDLPIVIEIVDSEEAIHGFLPVIDTMITGGLVTMEKVKVLHYRARPRNKSAHRISGFGSPRTPCAGRGW